MFRINKEAQIKVISVFFIIGALISGAFAINDTLKENNISEIGYISWILNGMINSLNDSYDVSEINEKQLVINEIAKENKNKLNKKTEELITENSEGINQTDGVTFVGSLILALPIFLIKKNKIFS